MINRITFSFCLLTFALPSSVFAQVGNCEPALGEAMLDAGNVRARILNNGGLFWRGSPHVYEVPKGEGVHAIFSASIWIAGKISGEVRAAASRYGPREYWPGPLDGQGNPPGNCALYDRLWEVRSDDISRFMDTGVISSNLAEWPWQLGAPVRDGDGVRNNYNLAGGDIPELFGDQRIWWIMNDRGNVHKSTGREPIGLEVHGSAFSFNNAGGLGNQTFYQFDIINKNAEILEDTYFGVFSDTDLGNFDDDYIGSDSLLHLAYSYNSDNEDEGNEGYGLAPPAIGYTFLETILAETDGLDNDRDGTIDEDEEYLGTSSVLSYAADPGPNGDPISASGYYSYLIPRWQDGAPVLEGLKGYDRFGWIPGLQKRQTRFIYSGDPINKTFWSENNADAQGNVNHPSDRRLLTATGPFDISPNDTTTIRFAILWARGKDNLDSVRQLKSITAGVRGAASSFYKPALVSPTPVTEPSFLLRFSQNFPNPFSESTNLSYSLPQSMRVRLAVYDILGREVELLVDTQQDAGIYNLEFEAGNLPAGIYLARIELDHLRFTKRMVLLR